MNSKSFNKAHKDFKVTSPFGLRNPFPGVPADHNGMNYHIGTDYAYPQRTELVSPVDVEILKTMDWGAYGGQIFAYSKYFDVTLHFAHVNSILTKQGQTIKAGTVLGLSGGAQGTTGAGTSTGAHLHIGLAKGRRTDVSKGTYGDGRWIDIDTFDFTMRKTNEEVAKEVLDGDWGNGQERKNRLTKAGYDYAAVQAIVNAQSKPKPTEPKPEYVVVQGNHTLYRDSTGKGHYGEKEQNLRRRNMKVLKRANERVQVSTEGHKGDNGKPSFDVPSFWIEM